MVKLCEHKITSFLVVKYRYFSIQFTLMRAMWRVKRIWQRTRKLNIPLKRSVTSQGVLMAFRYKYTHSLWNTVLTNERTVFYIVNSSAILLFGHLTNFRLHVPMNCMLHCNYEWQNYQSLARSTVDYLVSTTMCSWITFRFREESLLL
jgi:hypothetical protein